MTIIRHPDDDVPYNPEPPDDFWMDDLIEVGAPVAYDGAIVVFQENGDWLCEHGRNETGSPRATAHGCVTHCKGGTT